MNIIRPRVDSRERNTHQSQIMGWKRFVPSVPSVKSYFRSFYYPSTHLPPVDLQSSEFECSYTNLIQKVQTVTSIPTVQEILSEPFCYDPKAIQARNAALKKHGFSILGSKPGASPFYNVVEHPQLKGWVIKAAGLRVDDLPSGFAQNNDQSEACFFHPQDSLMRVAMNKHIRQKASELNIPIEVPEEYLVPYAQKGTNGDLNHSYCIISKKLDILSVEETVNWIKKKSDKEQNDIGCNLSKLIEAIGYSDSTLENIRVTRRGTLAIVDTESCGLLVPEQKSAYPFRHSIEKCARVGLYVLATSAQQHGLNEVAEHVNFHYNLRLKQISQFKKILSYVCPLIPVIFLIVAVIQTWRIKKVVEEIKRQSSGDHVSVALRRRYYQLIEGVPFPAS